MDVLKLPTVNVDIVTLYIFLRNTYFTNIRKNMYNMNITCFIPYVGIGFKNVYVTPSEIGSILGIAKIDTLENIYVDNVIEQAEEMNTNLKKRQSIPFKVIVRVA